jgi:hypothetical protein
MAGYRYEIEPGGRSLGGGWRLRIWQREPDGTEIEIGHGAFLHETTNAYTAYIAALQFAKNWLSSHEDATDEQAGPHEPHTGGKGILGRLATATSKVGRHACEGEQPHRSHR